MSGYHPFSLAQHLPNSKKDKQHQHQKPQEQQFFNQDPFINATHDQQHVLNSNNLVIDNNALKSIDEQHDWSNHNTNNTLNSILNNSTANFNYTRHHTAPVNNNNHDFHPLFNFLSPFDDHLIISHHHSTSTATSATNNSVMTHYNNNEHQSLFLFDERHHTALNKEHQEEEERSIIPYFDRIQEPHHYINKDTNSGEIVLSHIQHTTSKQEEMNNSTGFLEFQSSSSTSQINAVKMKPAIQAYLYADDPIKAGERTVIIMTSKVAQKSYGTEKRFLCPPPTAILVGSSWWTPPQNDAVFHDKDNIIRAPPSLTICISGETPGQQSGKIEWYSLSGTLVGQTGGSKLIIQPPVDNTSTITPIKNNKEASSDNKTITLSISGENKSNPNADWYRNSKKETLAGGRCILKRLYINDGDEKRKKVECLIKVQLANGLMLGTLSSRGIKVISKPSKKRQSVKNIELCIYHGTTVSLFNRVRSQTVSTKYLGVSSTSIFEYPGRLQKTSQASSDTCFVGRTNSWDPFVIWIVDTTQHVLSDEMNSSCEADEYIGCTSLVPTIPYPKPPTIALKNKTSQPLAIRYNQHVVLQCLTTGLVSPVMIVRKVDKASTVVGGARCPDEFDPSFLGGGEFGDEVLGDPVSQLHKIALQIVNHENVLQQNHVQQTESHHFQNQYGINSTIQHQQQQTSVFHFDSNNTNKEQKQQQDGNNMMPKMTGGPVTYLACLNDIVGTHKTTDKRSPIKGYSNINPIAAAAQCYNFAASALSSTLNKMPTSPSINRKRRVSMLEEKTNFEQLSNSRQMQIYNNNLAANAASEIDGTRRRVSSLNDAKNRFQLPGAQHQQNLLIHRSHSISTPPAAYNNNPANTAAINRKNSIAANSGQALAEFDAYWSEDVTDAAVWTIVGIECARYTFWTPPHLDENKQQQPEKQITASLSTPFPCLTHFIISNDHYIDLTKRKNQQQQRQENDDYNISTAMMTVSGENFTRDLQIWFGDIKAPFTEYRNREMLVCRLPPREELMHSVGLVNLVHGVTTNKDDNQEPRISFSIRILLVRDDGVVYKTSQSYSFC